MKIDIRECLDAREWCDSFIQRYIVLLDNATYMESEHIQKEKEYGITWRSAFKAELQKIIDELFKQLVNPDGNQDPNANPFSVLH